MKAGFFTGSDLKTITKAALLAEGLTQRHFGLSGDEWKVNPYGFFTRRQIHDSLHEAEAFAHVILYERKPAPDKKGKPRENFGIVLQDPNILLALLRSSFHDLWTLGLFILTHELTHIIRFRKFGVDFFTSVHERDKEEKRVHHITREILSGVTNTDYVLDLYESRANPVLEKSICMRSYGGA
ncbi:MAG: hypothetical protein WCG29_11245 [Desulfomonile sp.]